MIDIRYQFIQIAIGTRKSLSVSISDADWQRLFEFCKKQSLIGVGFTAVEKLHTLGVVCPVNLRMQWLSLTFQIEKRNALLNEQCKKLTVQYGHDGLATCILKGQSNLLNYPEELRMRRMPGDIDVWCIPPKDGLDIAVATVNKDVEYVNYKCVNAVIEYVRMQFRLQDLDDKPKTYYHHLYAPKIDDTEVEVHYRPAFLRSPLRNWRMQRWFENHADECMKNKTQLGFSMMASSVNVVYQMCHLYTHIFEGGIGLRQLMDYYFALRVWHNDVMECKDLQSQGMWSEGLGTAVMSATEVMAVLRSFGMGKFAAAVMYVLQEAFENEECLLELEMRNEKLGIERELKEINRELKEISPQADEVGEQQLAAIGQQLKEICPQADDRSERECPQIYSHIANIKKSSSSSASFREFKKNIFVPWMICEPNEKEGRKLMAEIMQGGNFGQYDTRDATLKKGGMMKHGVWKLKRVMRLVSSYPEEAMWEPWFRVWHLVWRGING